MITDGSAARKPEAWLARIARWIGEVDFVQIREPELNARELTALTRSVCALERRAKVLVNDRADVAVAAGADGVHLRDGSFQRAAFAGLIVSVAAHDVQTVRATSGADLILLAPIFDPISKDSTRPPLGLDTLREAAASVSIPVIALGGITRANARACMEAGAAGIAGISLFSWRLA